MQLCYKSKLLIIISLLSILFIILSNGCSSSTGSPLEEKDDTPEPPGNFGETTSAVVIVNPVINQGSTTTIVPGTVRENISIRAADLPSVNTNATGLATISDLPVDSLLPLIFEESDTLNLNVFQENELYDVVVSFKNDQVEEIFPAVRYPVGGDIIELDTTMAIADSILEDNTIIVLKEGTYSGNFDIRAEGVLIFGAWTEEDGPLSVIEDSVMVSGGGARIRGVKINGKLTVRANYFEAAFCEFNNADISGNDVMLLRNEFTAGQVIVPSSAAILVDNINIP